MTTDTKIYIQGDSWALSQVYCCEGVTPCPMPLAWRGHCWSWHRSCCTENCECWKLWVLPSTKGWAFQGPGGGRAALSFRPGQKEGSCLILFLLLSDQRGHLVKSHTPSHTHTHTQGMEQAFGNNNPDGFGEHLCSSCPLA